MHISPVGKGDGATLTFSVGRLIGSDGPVLTRAGVRAGVGAGVGARVRVHPGSFSSRKSTRNRLVSSLSGCFSVPASSESAEGQICFLVSWSESSSGRRWRRGPDFHLNGPRRARTFRDDEQRDGGNNRTAAFSRGPRHRRRRPESQLALSGPLESSARRSGAEPSSDSRRTPRGILLAFRRGGAEPSAVWMMSRPVRTSALVPVKLTLSGLMRLTGANLAESG